MPLFRAIQDLLFPPLCLGCSRRLDNSRPPLFCGDCYAQLHFISSPLCPCCGTPYTTGADHLCPICLKSGYHFDRARSLLLYKQPASELVLRLKFGGQLSGLHTFASLVAGSTCLGDLGEPDYIVPVPLHGGRIRQRGFNQATLLARGCFPQWQAKIHLNILRRNRASTPQAQLSGKQRRKNLRNAFSLQPKVDIKETTILLVDDVLTTGSTVNECAHVLRKAGAKRIEVFTLARSLGRP